VHELLFFYLSGCQGFQYHLPAVCSQEDYDVMQSLL